MNFNTLPFEDESITHNFKCSEFYLEFNESPKLRIHRLHQDNDAPLPSKFGITSEWFPKNKFLTFSINELFLLERIKLPIANEERLAAVADLIMRGYHEQMLFLKAIEKVKSGQAFELPSPFSEEELSESDKDMKNPDIPEQIVSLFMQLDKKEDFIEHTISLIPSKSETELELIWDCLIVLYSGLKEQYN